MSLGMAKLVDKIKAEFSNVEIEITDELEINNMYDGRYTVVADGTPVSGDTTHVLFERIKNILGERQVGKQ